MRKHVILPAIRNAARATGLATWQTGRLFRKTAQNALEAIQDVLRAEVQKGNVQLVADFLANKALPAAKVLLLERMAARMLVRIGLRGALATNVIGWVLPFALEALVRAGHKTGFFEKLKANATISDALHRLEELKQTAWKTLAPDTDANAETPADDATLLPAEGPNNTIAITAS
ncbi:hypothetical protein [Hymenobacter cavernae]|uniref:DUF697 domain-containing protein n=1 Tax=Hymenobacter cavernae TaxID=2044852 RepID=A0ABQ1U045_9BACT|nr:hypothetical protein [Hymenobacter cavernae]GGF07246.1 hypothetical protein GCM10011383_17900 [Hymenobacter cavernae]